MTIIQNEQISMFLVFLISGLIIGLMIDMFRIIRKSFKISDLHTYIEDIILGLLIGVFLIYMLYVYNSKDVRFYMIFAICFGFIIYMLTLSKYFININVKLISFFKLILNKIIYIIIFPFKVMLNLIKKIFKKPYMILVINIKKLKNVINYQKYKKNLHKKKDFIK